LSFGSPFIDPAWQRERERERGGAVILRTPQWEGGVGAIHFTRSFLFLSFPLKSTSDENYCCNSVYGDRKAFSASHVLLRSGNERCFCDNVVMRSNERDTKHSDPEDGNYSVVETLENVQDSTHIIV
jgi:hypothetical protein